MRPTGLLLGVALEEVFGYGLLAQALSVNNKAQVTGSTDTSVTTAADRSTGTSSTTTTTSESTSTTSTTSSTSTSTGVTTHTIQVGPKASPHAYVPHTITANVGDVLVFEFYPTNHSVAKADYLAPCVPAGKDEFWSGEFNTFNEENGELVGDPPTWSLVVNDTEPTFFYCTALGSCQNNGMVGVINPNSSQTFQDQYKRALTYPYMLVPGQSMPAETADTGSTSSSSSTTSSSGSGGSHGLSTGAIAGIAVASVAFVLILAALCWTLGRNRVYEKWMTSQDGRTERTARWALFSSHAHAPVPQKSELDSNTGSGPRTHASDSAIYSYANTSHRMASEPEATDTSSMYGSLQRGSGKWNWDTHQPGRHQRAPTELEANSISPTNVYTREYR